VILFSLVYSLAGAPDLSVVQVVSVNKNSPAETAGLLPGDQFLTVNGKPVTSSQALSAEIYANLDKDIPFTVRRNGETITTHAVPRSKPPEGEGAIGIIMTSPVKPVTWGQALPLALRDTYQQARTLLATPIMLLRGQVPADQARLVGPKGMYDIYTLVRSEDQADTATTPNAAPIRTLSLLATISIALGITNLLPIPALDGGRILFVLPELIFRKRVPARYENMIHLIGFATLIVLMLIITAQDIINPIQLR